MAKFFIDLHMTAIKYKLSTKSYANVLLAASAQLCHTFACAQTSASTYTFISLLPEELEFLTIRLYMFISYMEERGYFKDNRLFLYFLLQLNKYKSSVVPPLYLPTSCLVWLPLTKSHISVKTILTTMILSFHYHLAFQKSLSSQYMKYYYFYVKYCTTYICKISDPVRCQITF